MKIFTGEQIRKADAYTIRHEPILSIDLMERAARQLATWVMGRIDKNACYAIFAGPGNNGGDALALARILYQLNFNPIDVYLYNPKNKLSADCETNKNHLLKETSLSVKEIKTPDDFPEINTNSWVIDGLFGTGLTRTLDGVAMELVRHINKSAPKGVLAIDIPSGLFANSNTNNNRSAIIKATHTLTFQFPKFSFFLSDNHIFTGIFEVLDIGLHADFINSEPSNKYYLTADYVSSLIEKRDKYSHKGTFGHGLLIAGSYGMMGAAVLASRATLRSGAGLVTAHAPRLGINILQTSVPESLVSIDESDIIFTGAGKLDKYNAIAIGPGIQTKNNTVKALKDILLSVQVPLVVDADALNIIAENNLLDMVPQNTVLTPHPKEFDRLAGSCSSHEDRIKKQIELCTSKKIFIILKGAHSSIVFPDGTLYFNTTGNAGMATGGSGDVLTGMLLGLLSQGYTVPNASVLATYLHGLAADIAVESIGQESLIASDIINYIGKAFLKVKNMKTKQ